MGEMLALSDGSKTIAAVLGGALGDTLAGELFDLWQKRLIRVEGRRV